MRRPLSITASAALPMTKPAMRIERPECEPPPTGMMSVSPCTRWIDSNGTPSHSLTHCAKLVSCPCPLDSVPTATSNLPTGAAVGCGRRRVAEHRGGAVVRGRHAVKAGADADAFAQRHDRGRVAADIAQMRAAQSQKPPTRVERELDFGYQVAPLVVAQK